MRCIFKQARALNVAILFLLLGSPFTLAVNFDTCLANVRSGQFGLVGGTDNHGAPVNIANATAITYPLCIAACGAGQEPFEWSVFSQQFSSWLLPWLALVSQLPFGANDKLDNLESVLLTVGSPTLAAYSLALTVLNGRWIARRFLSYTYPNTQRAVRILSSLQQSPLRVNTGYSLLSSLVVLPQNNEWWEKLVKYLNYTHTWSISAATSIAWVIIAYVFTVVDSFTGDITTSINANGQGVGSLWLWLVPVVIGWLQLSPKCDSERLEDAVKTANTLAYVACSSDQGNTPLKASELSERRAISLNFMHHDDLHRDELCSAPIYNYARFLSWVQAVEEVSDAFRAASDRCHNHISVDETVPWETKKHARPHDANRIGTAAQVDEYCKPLPNEQLRLHVGLPPRSAWGPDVFSRILYASALALLLQWGTTASAVVVVWFTPTKGLGCRSASYITYGVLSTFAWILIVTSSFLTHYTTIKPRHYKGHPIHSRVTAKFTRKLSITLRRIGKLIAFINAFFVVISCLFQFSNFYDRCFCNSSVFGLGKKAYNVIQLVPSDVDGMTNAWIGGVGLAGGTAIIYFSFVYLFIDPRLPPEHY